MNNTCTVTECPGAAGMYRSDYLGNKQAFYFNAENAKNKTCNYYILFNYSLRSWPARLLAGVLCALCA